MTSSDNPRLGYNVEGHKMMLSIPSVTYSLRQHHFPTPGGPPQESRVTWASVLLSAAWEGTSSSNTGATSAFNRSIQPEQ